MKHSFILYLLFGMVFFQIACTNSLKSKNEVSSPRIELINRSLDSVTSAKDIPLDRLINEHVALDGQTIETEGIVYFQFENVAIGPDKEYNGKCFWLDLNGDLPINDSLLRLASGQKLVIKGTIDNSSKGHLSDYLATIRNVYYLKTK